MNSLAVTHNVPTRIWGAPQIGSRTRPGRRGKHNGCPPCSLTKRGPHPRLCSYKYPPPTHLSPPSLSRSLPLPLALVHRSIAFPATYHHRLISLHATRTTTIETATAINFTFTTHDDAATTPADDRHSCYDAPIICTCVQLHYSHPPMR